jgi:hypothetical protein
MAKPGDTTGSRATVMIALIGLAGSLGVAYINRQGVKADLRTNKSELELRFKNLRGIQVQSGFVEGINSLPDWTLHIAPVKTHLRESTPPRVFTKRVDFPEAFSSLPSVVVGIRALDASREANTRIIVSAGNIDTRGFTLRIQTWSDSKLYDVILDWLAYQQ